MQWFYQEGHPVVIAEHYWDEASRTYSIITRQEIDYGTIPYWIPLDIDFYQAGKMKSRQRVILSKLTDTFTFNFPDWQPDAVSFDAEKSILADITEVKPMEMWQNQLKNGPLMEDYLGAMAYLKKENKAYLISEIPALLNHPSWTIRESAVLVINEIDSNYAVSDRIKQMLVSDPKASVRLAAIGFLENKGEETIPLIERACFDSSYRVAGNALILLSELNPSKAKEILHANLNTKDMEYRMSMGVTIALLKEGDYVDFLSKLMDDSPEYAKYEVLGVIAQYGESTTGDTRKKLIQMLEDKKKKNSDGLMGFYLFAIITQLKK
jgi:hypothetical protein